MTLIILKTIKNISFTKWAKETFAHFLLELISKLIIQKRNKPIAVLANDNISNHICTRGFYAEGEMSLIKKIMLKTNKTLKNCSFIDIGANIGNHSIFFSEIFEEVHSFEPNPIVYPILKANSEIYKNIKSYNLGLGNKEKKEFLKINKNNLGASHVRKHFPTSNPLFKSSYDIQIDISKLDLYINALGNVSLIKLDIEGMEYLALKGASQVLCKYKPVIQFEFLTQNLLRPKVFSFLGEIGYQFYEIVNDYDLKPKQIRRVINLFELIKNKKVITYKLKKINNIEKRDYIIVALQQNHIDSISKF
tara:strand:+ start:2483 stop:3400 length:918 start_codon:yes stop_codon:yes gene_type:complete